MYSGNSDEKADQHNDPAYDIESDAGGANGGCGGLTEQPGREQKAENVAQDGH